MNNLRSKKILGITFASLLLGACAGKANVNNSNSSAQSNEPTSTYAILHGNSEPADTLGVDYNIYVNDSNGMVYEKNNGTWLTRDTFAKYENLSKTASNIPASLNPKLIGNNLLAKESANKVDLVQILVSTIYSTNVSFDLYTSMDDRIGDFIGKYKIDGDKIDARFVSYEGDLLQAGHAKYNNQKLIFDMTYPETPENLSINILDHEIGNTTLTCLPIPSMESIVFNNAIVYDDMEKGPTSIALKHIDSVIYENGVYTIPTIPYSYTNLSTYYVQHTTGTGNLGFSFELNEDNSLKNVLYTVTFPNGCITKYKFVISDFHKTVVENCSTCTTELNKQ